MAVYSLDQFNILVVEDNSYVRTVFRRTLMQFRVGNVYSKESGAEAIEFMKQECQPGGKKIDMIISDLIMSPLNGLMLLRWVRGAKESPNRFMPFIMLSGAADGEYVSASRDLGATEFLGKPFSATSVYKRLLEVIDHPRQFVTTQNYYGPDRRRRNSGPPSKVEERRVTEDKDVVVVRSATQVARPEKPTDVWYFRLPNKLQQMASGGMGGGGGGEVPTNLLEEAEESLERAAVDFREWALEYLKTLSDLCVEALGVQGSRSKYFDEINLLAHELRGQGGTFGFPLISTFGKMLYEATGKGCSEDDSAVEIVKAHIDAMRAVVRGNVSGDGGDIGRELYKVLRKAIDGRAG